jgi:hypothetical protein
VERPDLPRPTLEISCDGQTSTRWRLTRLVVLVGSAPSCQVQLGHTSVSRFHCSLVRTPLGVWVVDLLGRGGTLLNGNPVPWAQLEDGAEVGVGVFRIRVSFRAEETVKKEGVSLFVPAQPVAAAPIAAEASMPCLPALPAFGQPQPFLPSDLDRGPEGIPQDADPGLMLPVMEQFNQMQQQMFEQFHQTMLLMFRLFSTLHQEQAALIRQELQHIHNANLELRGLKEQMSTTGPSEKETSPSTTGTGRPEGRRVAAPRPAANETARFPTEPPGGATSGPATATTPMPPVDGDVHTWLSQRIEVLEAERQTRWQRILSFMRGP